MKHLKILGLAAVGAVALVVLVGASNASATVLCNVEGEKAGTEKTGTTCPPGPPGHGYQAGVKIHAVLDSGVNADLTDGSGNVVVRCTSSTLESEIRNEGGNGEAVIGEVTSLTWGGCTSPLVFGEACTVHTVKGGVLAVSWIEKSHNGTLSANGAEVTSQCTGIVSFHCIFVTNSTHLGVVTGGNPATIDIEGAPIPQTATSSLCPTNAFWDAKYEITAPKPLYVAGHT